MNDDMHLILRAGQSGGLVTSDDVRAVGLSTSRWRRRTDDGAWIRVTPHHWRHVATPLTWEMEVRAGIAWLGENAALYGPTAAAWWGLDGFDRIGRALFVVPRNRRFVAGPLDIRTTTQWSPADLVVHRGRLCTSVTRTIIDLAAGPCTAHQLAASIDSGVRARRTSVPALRHRLDELGGRGRSGASTLRELLLDSGGESFLERRILRLLRTARLPRPVCQVVHRHGTASIARVDFQFAGSNVVVEVGGRLGHSSDAERRKDAHRRNELQAEGMLVLEFTTADVLDDPEYVLASVRHALGVSVSSSARRSKRSAA